MLDNMKEIYQQHAKFVYKYLLSVTHDENLSEELTQETFYQALRSIDRYKGECKISTWLCQIAKHLWYKHLKKRKIDVPLSETEILVPSVENQALSRETHIGLMRRIHEFEEPMREVMYLRISGDLTFREIGDILGRTETWARVTFYRGKEKLLLEVNKDEK